MAKFMVPATVTILEGMPRTSTGKPQRGKLLEGSKIAALAKASTRVLRP